MENSIDKRDSLTVRIISAAFVALALAIFKPFGLEAMQWQAYFHLLVIWVIGVGICIVTDSILTILFRMPSSTEKGVSYIIHRNLWFQLINTPLIALSICIYRHFVLSRSVEGNLLSWGNYLETLVIIAFCSFAIGLYWRFRFRNKYLAAELEELQQLNEHLESMNASMSDCESADAKNQCRPSRRHTTGNQTITLTGTTSETVTLQVRDLLYIESVGNYVKVCHLTDSSNPATKHSSIQSLSAKPTAHHKPTCCVPHRSRWKRHSKSTPW